MSVPPAAGAATPLDTDVIPPGGTEISLKQAAILVGRNERTLRRKLDDGTLKGRKRPIETGGELWLVDRESLIANFGAGGVAEVATPLDTMPIIPVAEPAVRLEPKSETFHAAASPATDAATPPDKSLDPPPQPPTQTRDTRLESGAATPLDTDVIPPGGAAQPARATRHAPELTEFLLIEHGSLKEGHQKELGDIRNRHQEELGTLRQAVQQRDEKITLLQDVTGQLRQELGEVRGRAETESRMRAWLQQQFEELRQLQPGRVIQDTPDATPQGDHIIEIRERSAPAPDSERKPTRQPALLGATMGLLVLLILSGLVFAYANGLLGGQ